MCTIGLFTYIRLCSVHEVNEGRLLLFYELGDGFGDMLDQVWQRIC